MTFGAGNLNLQVLQLVTGHWQIFTGKNISEQAEG